MKPQKMEMIKAVFFDIDRTLVSHTRREVPASTLKTKQGIGQLDFVSDNSDALFKAHLQILSYSRPHSEAALTTHFPARRENGLDHIDGFRTFSKSDGSSTNTDLPRLVRYDDRRDDICEYPAASTSEKHEQQPD